MMQIIEQLEAKQRHYKRKIENMGTGLALFKISATDSQYGYHSYYIMSIRKYTYYQDGTPSSTGHDFL